MSRIATRAARSYVRVAFEIPAAMADDAAGLLVELGIFRTIERLTVIRWGMQR